MKPRSLPGAAVTAQTGHGGTWEVEAESLVLKVLSYTETSLSYMRPCFKKSEVKIR